jgi:hypothetical protein
MSIFRAKGYRDITCILSIAAIFPPPEKARKNPDNKKDEDLTFHFTIVNDKDLNTERSAYIELTKGQLKDLSKLIDGYLNTGITKEI